MIFEHMGLNVADKPAAVEWYAKALGLTLVRDSDVGPAFLNDSSGRTVLELYANRSAAALDFPNLHYFTFHIAFVVTEIEAETDRLVALGAEVIDPLRDANGDKLVMLRDPFGLCVQLVKRVKPFF